MFWHDGFTVANFVPLIHRNLAPDTWPVDFRKTCRARSGRPARRNCSRSKDIV